VTFLCYAKLRIGAVMSAEFSQIDGDYLVVPARKRRRRPCADRESRTASPRAARKINYFAVFSTIAFVS
jgi:hypothetical protein